MIDKTFLKDGAKKNDSEKVGLSNNVHEYAVLYHKSKYINGRVWVLGAKSKYQQYRYTGLIASSADVNITYSTPVFGFAVAVMPNTVLNVFPVFNW